MASDHDLKLVRIYADAEGETHLADLRIPDEKPEGADEPRVLREIPTTTLRIAETLQRRPSMSLHVAPRRQLGIVLRGECEITTTDGDSRRFGRGDCLLIEDTAGKGHTYEDVGDERLVTAAIGLPEDWQWPSI